MHADDDWTPIATRSMRADSEHDAGPCHDMPRTCHRVDSVHTNAGTVELYAAVDARKDAEYQAMYALVLADKPDPVVTRTLQEGGQPNAHHYEMCGTQSDWCERIVSSTPRLAVDRTGVVTLVVKTITLAQRWADKNNVARGTVQERHVRVRTVRCAKGADGWRCSSKLN